jgi:acyl-CoA reductase-like NAD-dependent aldehyde dehydrogenase
MAAAAAPFSTVSPLDGKALDPVVATTVDEVPGILEKARAAQAIWGALPLADRIDAIYKVKDRVLDRGEEIARTLRAECGKPEGESWTAEVLPNADLIEHWVEHIEATLAPEEVHLDVMTYPGKSGVIFAVPRGVIALITPWNFPIAIPLRTLVPALLAGNAVVFKPSEHSPRAGAIVARLFEGLVPDGVVSLLQGAGDVGAAVIAGGVDLVVFTGSVATGKKIALAAAERLVPVSLELGGKDAAIVLDDADLERTARGLVWGAFNNAGQNCASIERVYVDRKIAKPLIARMVELTKSLSVGDDISPLTTAAQLEIVKRHVSEASASGSKVLCGGKETGLGLGYEPTIVEVPDGCDKTPLIEEETFGPVLPVMVFSSEDEAVRRANASRYGLTASVWTKKIARGEAIADRLRTGVVTVNNHGFTAALAAAPWSGIGESGYGITNSRHAVREFTRPRFVLVDRSSAKSELWWMPYSASLVATVRALAILRSRTRGIGEKIKALWSLLRNAPKRLMGR